MLEDEYVILSLTILLFNVIIFSILFLLTIESCLAKSSEPSYVALFQTTSFLNFFLELSKTARHPFQLNGEIYRFMHLIGRKTTPPPKQNLALIGFRVNFFCVSRPVPRLVSSGITVQSSWNVILRSSTMAFLGELSLFYFFNLNFSSLNFVFSDLPPWFPLDFSHDPTSKQ